MTRIYANLNDLAKSLYRSNVIQRDEDMKLFAEHLTNSSSELDFVNVGRSVHRLPLAVYFPLLTLVIYRGKENADSKIRSEWRHVTTPPPFFSLCSISPSLLAVLLFLFLADKPPIQKCSPIIIRTYTARRYLSRAVTIMAICMIYVNIAGITRLCSWRQLRQSPTLKPWDFPLHASTKYSAPSLSITNLSTT
jgi:hypothetical protein